MINEAGNRVLAVAADLMPLLRELAPLCPTIEHMLSCWTPLSDAVALGSLGTRLEL
jgi:hypothetical protein